MLPNLQSSVYFLDFTLLPLRFCNRCNCAFQLQPSRALRTPETVSGKTLSQFSSLQILINFACFLLASSDKLHSRNMFSGSRLSAWMNFSLSHFLCLTTLSNFLLLFDQRKKKSHNGKASHIAIVKLMRRHDCETSGRKCWSFGQCLLLSRSFKCVSLSPGDSWMNEICTQNLLLTSNFILSTPINLTLQIYISSSRRGW